MMKSINKKKNSNATEVLHTIKTYNNRFFTMWVMTFVVLIIVFIALILSFIYIISLKNEYEKVETITTEVEQETDEGNNYYIGRDGDING